MLHELRQRLSYANVIATLALFLTLGGGAYAAATLPRDSVRAKQIKAGAVRTAELRKGAVTSLKVRNRSLRAADFAPGQLVAGPAGPKGDQGAQGAPGPTASSFVIENGVTDVPSTFATVATLSSATSGQSGGALQMPVAGRMHVSSAVVLNHNGSDGEFSRVWCKLQHSAGAGPFVDVAGPFKTELEGNSNHDEANTIPVVAVVQVAAGQHDVRIQCQEEFGGTNDVDAELTTMSVIGVAG